MADNQGPDFNREGHAIRGPGFREWEQPANPRFNGVLRTQRYRVTLEAQQSMTQERFFERAWAAYQEPPEEQRRGILLQYRNPDDPAEQEVTRTILNPRTIDDLRLNALFMDLGLDINGSDVVPADYNLSLDQFDIRWIEPPGGGKGRPSYSRRDTPFFTLFEYKGSDGDCAFNVFRAVARDPPGVRNKTIRRELAIADGNIDLAALERLSRRFNVNVRVFSPELHYEERVFHDSPATGNRCTARAAPALLVEHHHDPTWPVADLLLEADHYSHIVRFKDITLCPVTGDTDTTRGPRQLRARIIEQGRPYYSTATKRKRARKNYKEKILVFDFETVWDPADNEILKPYCVGWFEFDSSRTNADFSVEMERFAAGTLRDAACVFTNFTNTGAPLWDCAEQLVRHMLSAPDDVRYTLVGFNNTSFDNLILARAADKLGVLTDVFWAGSRLRDVAITRHHTLDLCKIVPSSLAKACESFNTQPVKVDGFDHLLPQNAYLTGRLREWINANTEKLCEYQMGDVFSTASLCLKVEAAIKQILNRGGVSVSPLANGIGTTGGLTWAAFKEFTPKVNQPVAAPDGKTDKFFRDSIVGGRTECVSGENLFYHGPLRMIDVTSLYPTVMAHAQADLFPERCMYGYYPVGKPIRTERYVPGKIGFYSVTVVRQPEINVLPKRATLPDGSPDRTKPLDWKFKGEFVTTTTSVSIELIRHHGGVIDVHHGYYFEEATRDMFADMLKPIIDEKSRQDGLKAEKSPEYNPAMRETAKLLMNSLSGKFAQRNFEDTCVLAKGAAALSIERKMRGARAQWLPLHGDSCLLIGKKPEDSVYSPTHAKPSHIAALIYENARMFMYHLLLARYRVYYMDTDSAAISAKDYADFRAKFPQLDPDGRLKELGDLEEEGLEKPRKVNGKPVGGPIGDNAVLYAIKPKCYYIGTVADLKDAQGNVKHKDYITGFSKQKCKGINFKRDRLLASDDLTAYDRMNSEEMHALYNRQQKQTAAFRIEGGVPVRVHKVTPAVAPLAPNALEFFMRLHENGKVAVMSSQLMKVLAPDRGFLLRQRYMVKTFGDGDKFQRAKRAPTRLGLDPPAPADAPEVVPTAEELDKMLEELLEEEANPVQPPHAPPAPGRPRRSRLHPAPVPNR